MVETILSILSLWLVGVLYVMGALGVLFVLATGAYWLGGLLLRKFEGREAHDYSDSDLREFFSRKVEK